MVAVGIVFDRREATQDSQQEQIRWGFQEINNPFVPDVSLALAGVDIGGSRISKEEGDRFTQAFGNRIGTTRPFPNIVGVRLINRPPANKKMALVFGEGLVNYNGYPSPSSFLTLQFNFERVPSPIEVSL